MSQRYFGIDLSGYSSGRTAIAEIEIVDQRYIATVYRGHPLACRINGRSLISDIVNEELAALTWLATLGMVLVDVPIDLGRLPCPIGPKFIWELTARPVDFAYGGLKPLADRIGAAVARFGNLSHAITPDKLRETYPAASLDISKLPSTGYKDERAIWKSSGWEGGQLAGIARGMRLLPDSPVILSDDEVDAIVCAFAGAAPPQALLCGDALLVDVRARISKKICLRDRDHLKTVQVPRNYQLFCRPPDSSLSLRVRTWKELDS